MHLSGAVVQTRRRQGLPPLLIPIPIFCKTQSASSSAMSTHVDIGTCTAEKHE